MATVLRALLWAALLLAAPSVQAAAPGLPSAAVAARITSVDGAAQAEAWHEVHGMDAPSWAALHQQLRAQMGRHAGARQMVLVYRIALDREAAEGGEESWALYLPHLYSASRFTLNGMLVATMAGADAHTHVRWLRPGLLPVPDALWHPGRNEWLLEIARDPADGPGELQGLAVGPLSVLSPVYERRLFWARTMPQITIVICLVVGVIVTAMWARRRSEVLYGLFGMAAILWSVRTGVFVIEVLPEPLWRWWRVVYFTATGGFIVLLALFSLRLCGLHRPVLERVFVGYALLGPALLVATLGGLDKQISLVWVAGLMPIGLATVGFTALAAWRQRGGVAGALFVALLLATLAGVHDYLVDWHSAFSLPDVVREWLARGVFLMHHAANLLLLVMGVILALRHIEVLDTVAELNRDLELRVARREEELRLRLAQVAALEREQVIADERQRIMRDLHDGLGSRMFTTLLRVQRGALDMPQVARMLRDCIADMRLIFDVVAPDQPVLADALGGLRFRWEPLLSEAQVASEWQFDGLEGAASLSPMTTLQLLRILQESLTNAVRHAAASRVTVRACVVGQELQLSVQDDGVGFCVTPDGNGRGLANMRDRALRVGATLDLVSRPGHSCVALRLPLSAAHLHLRAPG